MSCCMAGKDGCNGVRVSSELLLHIVKLLIIICVGFFWVVFPPLFHGISLTAAELLGLWGSFEEFF